MLRFPSQLAAVVGSPGHQSPRPFHSRQLAPSHPPCPDPPQRRAHGEPKPKPRARGRHWAGRTGPSRSPGAPAPPRPSRSHPRRRQSGDPAAVVPGPPRVLRAGSGAVTPEDARHSRAAAAAPSPREPGTRAGTRGGGEGNALPLLVTVVSDDGPRRAPAAPGCRCPALAAGDDAIPGRAQ